MDSTINRLFTHRTAVYPPPRTRRLYLGVLEDRLGVQEGALPGVSEQDLLHSFGTSMKQRSREIPCFGYGVMSSEEWWGEVVRETFRGAGVAEESLEGVFDEVFDELFHHVFTSQPTWELVPVGSNALLMRAGIQFCFWGGGFGAVETRESKNVLLFCVFVLTFGP